MKGFKKLAFNLFTKRVEVKISNIPNDERIKYLVLKLREELSKQGKYEFNSTCSMIEIWEHKDSISLDSPYDGLVSKRVICIKKGEKADEKAN